MATATAVRIVPPALGQTSKASAATPVPALYHAHPRRPPSREPAGEDRAHPDQGAERDRRGGRVHRRMPAQRGDPGLRAGRKAQSGIADEHPGHDQGPPRTPRSAADPRWRGGAQRPTQAHREGHRQCRRRGQSRRSGSSRRSPRLNALIGWRDGSKPSRVKACAAMTVTNSGPASTPHISNAPVNRSVVARGRRGTDHRRPVVGRWSAHPPILPPGRPTTLVGCCWSAPWSAVAQHRPVHPGSARGRPGWAQRTILKLKIGVPSALINRTQMGSSISDPRAVVMSPRSITSV